jgi:hypothetical protein
MEYIYQADFEDFPTSLDQVEAARVERDGFAEVTLGLASPIIYTRSVFTSFDIYSYGIWLNFDKMYCVKAGEWHCANKMTNKHKTHHLLVGNGNVIYCNENVPTADEINTLFTSFMVWNGSNAASHIGGFPFTIYHMRYVPKEDESDSVEYEADVSQAVEEEEDAKPSIDLYNSTIPPPPQNSPVLRRSERLAKKKLRRSQRIAKMPDVDYTGMA